MVDDMRRRTTDEHGREVLRGLTAEETEFYRVYLQKRRSGERLSRQDGDRFLELHNKHELARMQVIMAENQLRREDPTRQ